MEHDSKTCSPCRLGLEPKPYYHVPVFNEKTKLYDKTVLVPANSHWGKMIKTELEKRA